jgi:tetratricopeptide (TPR) repeat protein
MARQKADPAEKILKQAAAEIEKSFGARLVLSELYAGQGRVEDAIAVLAESLSLSKEPANPGILNAKNALARIYFASGEVEKAANVIDEVLNESPRNVDASYTRGRIALVRNEPLSAVAAFRNVVGERPDFVMAQLSLAEALRRNNQNELALDSLRQALAANPASKELGKALARAHLINGDAKNAEAQLRRIVAADLQDMSARADLGDFLLAQKNETAAKQVFAEIQTAAPTIPLGYLKLAGLHASAKAWDQAAAVLEAGYAATPQSAPILQGLAEAYLAQNKREKAVQLLRKRLSANPKEAFTLNLLGKVHFAAKDVAQAEAAFKGAIDAEPMWPEPYNNLASLYIEQGKMADAVRQFQHAIESNPRSPSAYMALGFIHRQQKNHAEAIRVYEQGVENVPNFWGAYNDLAFLLAEHGRSEHEFKRALELARKAQRLQPDRMSVGDTLAWVNYKMGNLEESLAIFSELLVRYPEDPVLNYHAGMVLLKAGRNDEAREKLQAALAESKPFYGREDAEKMLLELKAKG